MPKGVLDVASNKKHAGEGKVLEDQLVRHQPDCCDSRAGRTQCCVPSCSMLRMMVPHPLARTRCPFLLFLAAACNTSTRRPPPTKTSRALKAAPSKASTLWRSVQAWCGIQPTSVSGRRPYPMCMSLCSACWACTALPVASSCVGWRVATQCTAALTLHEQRSYCCSNAHKCRSPSMHCSHVQIYRRL